MASPLISTIALVVAISLGAVLVSMAAYRMAIQERFDGKAAACLLVGAALVAAPLLLRPRPLVQPVMQDQSADVARLESELQAAAAAKLKAEEAHRTASAKTEALSSENATLRKKLEDVRKELQIEREKPSVAAQPIAPRRTTRRRPTRRRPTAVRQPAQAMGPDWVD